MSLGKAAINITGNLAPLKAKLLTAKSAISNTFKIASRNVKIISGAMGKKVAAAFNRMQPSIKRATDRIKNLGKAIKKVGPLARQATSLSFRGFGKLFRLIRAGLSKIIKLAKIAAVAVAGIGIASVKIASDVQESENLFRIAMGGMADSADVWAKQYAKSLNLFDANIKKTLSTFQLMLTSMGLGTDQAFEMSKGLTKLTVDLASFRNLKIEDAFLKLQAGITGESEPLKRLGILVNETAVKTLAMEDATIKARMSVKGASKELTLLEKVMFRYKVIQKATTLDAGDFKRTLDSTSNVFKQIRAQIQKTGDTIGTVFEPEVNRIGQALREWFVDNQDQIREWANVMLRGLKRVGKWIGITFKLIKQGRIKEVFDEIGRLFGLLVVRLATLLGKLIPVIAKLGFQAGQAFSDGLMKAQKGSKTGKILKVTGAVIGAPFQAVAAAGRFAGDIVSPFVTPRPARAKNIDRDIWSRAGSLEAVVLEVRKTNALIKAAQGDF